MGTGRGWAALVLAAAVGSACGDEPATGAGMAEAASEGLSEPSTEATLPVPIAVLEAALARGIDTSDPLEVRVDEFVVVLLVEQLAAGEGVEPVDGGLKVLVAPDGSLLARLGLHPGEVLVSLNGRELDSPGAVALGLAAGSRSRLELGVRGTGDATVRTVTYRVHRGLALRGADTGLSRASTDGDSPSRPSSTPRSPDLRNPFAPSSVPSTAPSLPEEAVEALEDDRFRIEAAAIPGLFEDARALGRVARVIPYTKDGEYRGFKLYGVRPGSLLRQLGLRSGDLVTTIDGATLTDVESAMATYERLKKLAPGDTLEVQIERRGKPMTLRYELR